VHQNAVQALPSNAPCADEAHLEKKEKRVALESHPDLVIVGSILVEEREGKAKEVPSDQRGV
jgi:hypothetical protein